MLASMGHHRLLGKIGSPTAPAPRAPRQKLQQIQDGGLSEVKVGLSEDGVRGRGEGGKGEGAYLRDLETFSYLVPNY